MTAMEFTIKSHDDTFRETIHAGQRWVGGVRGERYSIVIRNPGPRVEVVVTVDGRDVLTGEPGNHANCGYVIGPGETSEIDGWRKSLDDVAAFRMGDVADSYAAAKGDASSVGVIGVAVFSEHRPARGPVPVNASAVTRGATRGCMGTEFGETLSSAVTTVDFNRATSIPRAIHVIRYDSITRLVAAGILPAVDLGPTPNPFPGNPTGFCTQ